MTAPPGWIRRVDTGTAAALHRDAAGTVDPTRGVVRRSVRLVRATDRCVVLGSTQPPDAVDPARLEAAGMTMARRRSGGAAVVVGPGEGSWVEVTVPAGDDLWRADVGQAAWWVGRCWAGALVAAGAGPAEAWTGPLVRTAWSPLVCFAGLGPGEVTIGGRKVVGVSQRRTSAGVLFQCAVLARWAPTELLDVLALDPASRRRAASELAGVAVGIGDAVGAAVEAFVASLPPGGPRDVAR